MSDHSSPPSLLTGLATDSDDDLNTAPAYTARTGDVVVTVRSFWLEEHSQPEEQRYAWLYHVTIENKSSQRIQLLSRTWTIIDGHGHREDVHGAGVIGEQPVLGPKDVFDYTSGAELKTPTGFMSGQYGMISLDNAVQKDEKHFSVAIPTFSLDSPHHAGPVH